MSTDKRKTSKHSKTLSECLYCGHTSVLPHYWINVAETFPCQRCYSKNSRIREINTDIYGYYWKAEEDADPKASDSNDWPDYST